ncbi:MAG: ABC transporter permease [Acidimicrobiales bacterium]
MTTVAAPARAPAGHALPEVVSDAVAMTRRNLLHYLRVPALIVFSTVSPVMFVLLFTYVFGGAIPVGGVRYVDYLMAGIFVQTVAFGSTQTGVGLADDLSRGMVDRFRSLPMARSAVLAGRTMADTVRNAFVVLVMLVVGLLVGFRPSGSILAVGASLLVVVAFGLALSWISAAIGLAVGNVEAAQSAGFVWIFPLTFASSAFVPLRSMPGWLQAWAKVNPVTNTVNAARNLQLGKPAATDLWHSVLWMVAILVVFVPLAVRRYRRT